MNMQQHIERELQRMLEYFAATETNPRAFDLTGMQAGHRFWGCTHCWRRQDEAPQPWTRSVDFGGIPFELRGWTGCPACGGELKEFEATGEGTGTRLVRDLQQWQAMSDQPAKSAQAGFAEAGL